MASNIVIAQGFQGIKLYRMRGDKTQAEIAEWCSTDVKTKLTSPAGGSVTRAKFYLASQTETGLYLLICVHDKTDSNWSRTGRLDEFNDGRFPNPAPPALEDGRNFVVITDPIHQF
jgi:hypothetical protein